MRHIIKASMEDVSTVERFRFSLRCAACGYCWESQPVRFSKVGVQPENEGKRVIFQALYQREREDAFERAVTEALEHFSLCPICKRLVCVPTVRRFCRNAASRWKVCPRKTDDKGRRHR